MNLTIKNSFIIVLLSLGSATAITACCMSKQQKYRTLRLTHNTPLVSISSEQNRRDSMEDRHLIDPEKSVFGVFDGHGGSEAVNHVTQTFNDQFKRNNDDLGQTLESIELDIKQKNIEMSGTTAIVAHIKDSKATIANIGDSRAILIRNNQVLEKTVDHKPNLPSEKERIEKAGGKVFNTKYLILDHWRIGNEYINLSMSRALGDHHLKEMPDFRGLIATPEISQWPLQKKDIIVLASDGVWDGIALNEPNEAVAKIIADTRTKKNLSDAATLQQAAKMISTQAKRKTLDNITAMILYFDE